MDRRVKKSLLPLRASLRQLMLAVIFLGIAGLSTELLLLEHLESPTQWIPHITLGLGFVSAAAVYFKSGPATLRIFRAAMTGFIAVGILGVYLHYIGNVEFALERTPSLAGLGLLWKALRGATPALAPGAMVQLGLLGLLFTYRHPLLASEAGLNQENVD